MGALLTPVGATLYESGFQPVGTDYRGALLRERSLMQRASSYGQPLLLYVYDTDVLHLRPSSYSLLYVRESNQMKFKNITLIHYI